MPSRSVTKRRAATGKLDLRFLFDGARDVGKKACNGGVIRLLIAGAAHAQTPVSDSRAYGRSRQTGCRALRARVSKLRAVRAQETAGAASDVPLTLEDAVSRAMENNLDIAGRAAQPADVRPHARVARRELQARGHLDARPARQRAAADQPAEPRRPERVDDDLQRGLSAEREVGRRQLFVYFQQCADRLADGSARTVQPAVQQHAICSTTPSHCCVGSASIKPGSRCRRRSSTATTPS